MPSIKETDPMLVARGMVQWADEAISFVERAEAGKRLDAWHRPQFNAALMVIDDLRARIQTLLATQGD